MKSCLVLVKVWTKKQGFASLLKKILFLNFRWTSYVKSITPLTKKKTRLNDRQNTPYHTENRQVYHVLYSGIKHTHLTRDHTGTGPSKHLCLTVLPRKTSISKSNKKYLI